MQTRELEQRAAALTHLCNAGDAGRWGTSILLRHPEPEIRQFGVLVLQHNPSAWSRRRLLEMLRDPQSGVRELAALGLAIHGDTTIIPELVHMYAKGDDSAATAACLALERLGGQAAVGALQELAEQPAAAERRAALVEALASIGKPEAVPALLILLHDHQPCDLPTRAERLAERLAPVVMSQWPSSSAPAAPVSIPAASATTPVTPTAAVAAPSTRPRRPTIAERAAAALAEITGLNPPFSSDLPADRQQAAERTWTDWFAGWQETRATQSH